MKNINFLVVGVGGQGTVLAGDIMAEVGMIAGYDSKKSDVLGLAIRGGSVISHIRWGEKVNAPVIMMGKVDYLLAFEPLEALRQIEYLNPDSTVIINEYKIPPVDVSSGLAVYPSDEEIIKPLKDNSKKVYSFNATDMAVEIGNVKTVNIMLMGALSSFLDVSDDVWEAAIKKFVPEKIFDVNMKAFRAGIDIMKGREAR